MPVPIGPPQPISTTPITIINQVPSDNVNFPASGELKVYDGSFWVNQTIAGAGLAAAEAGIPDGGTTGQVLEKIDGDDYNVQWASSGAASTTITALTDTTITGPVTDDILGWDGAAWIDRTLLEAGIADLDAANTFSLQNTFSVAAHFEGHVNVKAEKAARFYDNASAQYIGLQAPNAIGAFDGDFDYVLPILPTTTGQILASTDAGVWSWVDPIPAPVLIKAITIESPGAAEDVSVFFTKTAITLSQLSAILVGSSTPSVTYTIKHHTDRSNAGNAVVTSPSATTSTTTGHIITSFDDATIPANSFVWLETTAQSGTVDSISVSLEYTED